MGRTPEWSYEEKQSLVVDYLCRLPKERQRDIFKEMPNEWCQAKRTEYLVEKITTIEKAKGKH